MITKRSLDPAASDLMYDKLAAHFLDALDMPRLRSFSG